MTGPEPAHDYVHEPPEAPAPDRIVRVLTYGIIFMVVCILVVIAYALLAGVIFPSAPRTRAEAVRSSMGAMVDRDPGNGRAWADYAEGLYGTGDKTGAFAALERGRMRVKDDSIRYLNNSQLHLLVLEGKNEDALKLAGGFVQRDFDLRIAQTVKNAQTGISVPLEVSAGADASAQLYVLCATIQGNLGKWKDVIDSCDNALKFKPRAADVIAMRGWARLRSGNPVGARADFRESLRYLPGDPSAVKGLREAEAAAKKKK